MEWLENILFEIDSDGAIDIDNATSKISEKLNENYVERKELEAANNKIKELELVGAHPPNEPVEDMKKQLEIQKNDHLEKIKKLNLKHAIEKLGATDTEYLMYKTADKVEFDKNGNIIDDDTFFKNIKSEYKTLFPEQQLNGAIPFNAPIPSQTITKEQFNNMTYTEKTTLFETSPEMYQSLYGN